VLVRCVLGRRTAAISSGKKEFEIANLGLFGTKEKSRGGPARRDRIGPIQP
jgi:hypothetical protein